MPLVIALLPGLAAAVFAAASWVMSSLSSARRAALRDTLGGGGQQAITRYLEDGPLIEARWLVLRALGTVLCAILVGRALPDQLGGWHAPATALIALLAYVVPSELIRVLAARNADRAAPLMLQVLRPFELLVMPIADPVHRLGRAFLKDEAWGPPAASPGLTETEVQRVVDQGEQDGSLGRDASQLIRNALGFTNVTSRELMIPRTQVEAFELGTALPKVLHRVAESEHAHYPVYSDSIDNIVGVLHGQRLLKVVAQNQLAATNLEELVDPQLLFVTETQSVTSVLNEMRTQGQHLALVIDEFGGFSGLLTMTGLVQKLAGHASGEPETIVELGPGRYLVDGRVSLPELSRVLHTALPESGQYHSVAGYVIAELGRVPEPGTQLKGPGVDLLVRESDARRVTKVELQIHDPPL